MLDPTMARQGKSILFLLHTFNKVIQAAIHGGKETKHGT